ncbi:glyoxalase [Streptomyces sp. WM4235]|uniref:VOC family protein n=1 Tax=unclassified Streptomyces TaxID=2593676 RepID=UPI0006AE7BA0|nr:MULTISPECIES: VOC family protein [unclassified Streptomyces]KOU64743.1 glyoxalase [Streptomyces sp. WM4235]MCX5076483.1 VOC family protein [Streptomyces sp. NBC_00424]MCX5156524.1 VOC family protein [Streptomyces sp. NBC_00291]WUD40484.1 VOC family protein [Streptomyces sp. NBC_00513]
MAAVVWSHVGLNCADQKATEEFYTRYFGFRRARVVDLGESTIVFLRQGDAYLELFAAGTEPAIPAHDDGPQAPGRLRHLAFQTDDVDAFLAELGDAAEVTLGPMDFDDFIHGWRTVWVRDPDGVIVEVSQGYEDEHGTPRQPGGPFNETDGA